MSRAFALLKAECLKVFGDVKIYWLNYIFGNLNVFFMFLGLFYAFSENQQDNIGKMLFLFGLMYWYFGVHAVDLISILIEEEIEQGTLEQLLMTRTPLSVSLMFRIAAQILFDLFKGVFVFALCAVCFQIDFAMMLKVEFWVSVVVFFTGLLAMYGFGYLIAGLSLVYKQMSSLASISSSLILFFSGTTITVDLFPAGIQYMIKLFPFYWSNLAIREILTRHGGVDWHPFMGLLVTSVFWITSGISAFYKCLDVVYEKGTTGIY